MVRGGQHAYVQWDLETTFKGGDATLTKVFGLNQKVTIDRDNSAIALPALNQNEHDISVYLGDNKRLGLEYNFSDPWWLELLMGTAVEGGGGGPTFTHTYTPAKTPKSAAIEVGIATETASVVSEFEGVVMKSATISTTVDNIVSVNAELLAAEEKAIALTVEATPPADILQAPYTFAHAELEFPSGTTVAEVQSIDLTIDSGAELIRATNAFDFAAAFTKVFKYTGKFSGSMFDKTQIDRITGRADETTLVITFTDGTDIVVFTGTGVIPKSHSYKIEAGEMVFEDVEFEILAMSIVATNSETSPP